MTELTAYRPEDLSAASDATVDVAQPLGRKNISVEVVDSTALADTRAAWADLLARGAAPNVFMDPALVRAAAEADPKAQHRVLMAWRVVDGRRRLAGVWAFAIRRPRKSPLPIRVLVGPAY